MEVVFLVVVWCITSSIVLGSFSLLLYAYIARGYKYRVRDEPCYVRRYVEEYYYKYSRTLEDNFYTSVITQVSN